MVSAFEAFATILAPAKTSTFQLNVAGGRVEEVYASILGAFNSTILPPEREVEEVCASILLRSTTGALAGAAKAAAGGAAASLSW